MVDGKSQTLLFDLWTKQLHKEYDQINWAYQLRLRKPQIIVVSVKTFYGQWDPLLRQIKISQQLIEKAPWHIVVEVLKHEIAHQLVTDELGIEEGHGPNFVRYCEHLGVHRSLQRSKAKIEFHQLTLGSIHDNSEYQTDSEAQKLISRVERLLSLAQSNSENEALIAMEKINELYEKYNIERIKKAVTHSDYTFSIIFLGSQKIQAVDSIICSILNEHFFVEPILTQTFCPKSCKAIRTIEIFGTMANVKMAEYVYYFLKNKATELWQFEAKRSQLSSSLKRSFQIGLLNGFNEKLAQSRLQRQVSGNISKETKGLISLDDPALNTFIRKRYPRLVRKRTNTRSLNRAAYDQGQREGMRIILNKGIEKYDPLSKFLLK